MNYRAKRKLEICCYSLESAIAAEKSGADRIELCDNYSEGGTTHSYATIKYSIEKLKIPVNVIIRPRGGDFLYSDIEYDIMKQDILVCKKLGVNGVVIGFLTSDGEIDIVKTKEVIEMSKPMEVTFHRAFDMCKDHLKALSQLKNIGITRVLTSGAKNTALEGINLLADLVTESQNEIIIMPGSGVNENNLSELIEHTNALEFHSSAKDFKSSDMIYHNRNIHMGSDESVEEFSKIAVDTDKVKKMKEIILST